MVGSSSCSVSGLGTGEECRVAGTQGFFRMERVGPLGFTRRLCRIRIITFDTCPRGCEPDISRSSFMGSLNG